MPVQVKSKMRDLESIRNHEVQAVDVIVKMVLVAQQAGLGQILNYVGPRAWWPSSRREECEGNDISDMP